MDIYLIKDTYNRFIPAFGSDYDAAAKIASGDTVKASITKPRNYQFHKKYFAFLDCLHRSMDEQLSEVYPTVENLRYVMMILIGEFDIVILPDGSQQKKPKSISFAAMDDIEFERVYSASIDAGLKYFLKDITREELERELINFM